MSEEFKIKVPKNNILWESTYDKDGKLKYYVTSNADRSKYFKYERCADGTVAKTATAESPKEFIK